MAGHLSLTLISCVLFHCVTYVSLVKTEDRMHSSVCVVSYPSDISNSLTVRVQAKLLAVNSFDFIYWKECGSLTNPKECTFPNDNKCAGKIFRENNRGYYTTAFTYHHSLTSDLTIFDVDNAAPVYVARYIGFDGIVEHVIDVLQILNERGSVVDCVEETSETFWLYEHLKREKRTEL
ncbi:hypothetical protein [Pteropox virus]|uniref:Uncharacterized protein n=1 Tax=Pteropox virus TaxID=1873698 RepID=A0A1B1MRI0_9POXV|nr:hypothetical protein [Pteropox virus]ANS71226.1 hypothetical protein [Pteropox virus]